MHNISSPRTDNYWWRNDCVPVRAEILAEMKRPPMTARLVQMKCPQIPPRITPNTSWNIEHTTHGTATARNLIQEDYWDLLQWSLIRTHSSTLITVSYNIVPYMRRLQTSMETFRSKFGPKLFVLFEWEASLSDWATWDILLLSLSPTLSTISTNDEYIYKTAVVLIGGNRWNVS